MNNHIREIRKEKGMTIEKLSKLSKVSTVYIYHLENGTRNNPSYEVMKDIAQGLGRSIEEVFLK